MFDVDFVPSSNNGGGASISWNAVSCTLSSTGARTASSPPSGASFSSGIVAVRKGNGSSLITALLPPSATALSLAARDGGRNVSIDGLRGDTEPVGSAEPARGRGTRCGVPMDFVREPNGLDGEDASGTRRGGLWEADAAGICEKEPWPEDGGLNMGTRFAGEGGAAGFADFSGEALGGRCS